MIRLVTAPRITFTRARRLLLLAMGTFFGLGLLGCAPPGPVSTPTPAAPSGTPSPTVGFPTLPPTATLTPPPSLTPTRDIRPLLGTPLVQDDFSTNTGWDLGTDAIGATSLEGDRLVLALHQAGTFRYVLVPGVTTSDFFLQVTIRTELCSPTDEFGALIRFTPEGEYYRVGVYCDGRARVTRVLEDSSIALVLPTPSPFMIPGAPAVNVLAVLAEGERFRIFLNGFEAVAARDRALPFGRLGLFGRTSRSTQLTVSFDDLEIYSLLPTPTATQALTP